PARVVQLQRRWNRGHRSGRDDRMIETELLLSARHELHPQRPGVGELGAPLQVSHLAMLHALSRAAGEPLHYGILEAAELREIDARLAEFDAPRLRVARL